MIKTLPITIISVGIHKYKIEFYSPTWNILNSAWTFIVERFDRYITERSDLEINKGTVRVDRSTRLYQDGIANLVNNLRQFGSNCQNIHHIFEQPMFISSKESEIIQIADASAYFTMKYLNQSLSSKAENYWNVIYDKLRKAPNGDPMGYGLKIFP